MDEALYFHVTLEPHHKHSGLVAGGKILFLAEVPFAEAKKRAADPEDAVALSREGERLAAELLPLAMTGHSREEGEDVMRLSCRAVPRPSEDLLGHKADAEKNGVRLWLMGTKTE